MLVADILKPITKKFLISTIKYLLANFAFNSSTKVLEIIKIKISNFGGLSASHLLSNHAENLQVDLFLDLKTFFRM